jgi:tRNA1Val (adenine37-N6)-methyltransferase
MAGRNTFCFKRFNVRQDGCAMKVGTDGVLLGAWCRVELPQDEAILDIGTGTGLIALQLAQRTESTGARIDAVEIDSQCCLRAQENFARSPWSDRLRFFDTAIQDFTEQYESTRSYNHIVTNPPWFVDSLASPDTSRTMARHSSSLSYDDLMKCCSKLLAPQGRISMVLPAGAETAKMIAVSKTKGFILTRHTEVHSTSESGPKRSLVELMHQVAVATGAMQNHSKIVIQDGGPGTFSAQYRELTRDFYLYF